MTTIDPDKNIQKIRSEKEMRKSLSNLIHRKHTMCVPPQVDDDDIVLMDVIKELLEAREKLEEIEVTDKQELIEKLADKEHDSWARWMQYLFSKCLDTTAEYVHGDDHEKAQAIAKLLSKFEGAIIIMPEMVEHWQRQANTDYAQLSEREKQSDRDEVCHILPIIEAYCKNEEG